MPRERSVAASGDFKRLLRLGVVGGWTDGQLLERFMSLRDEAAFEALVERHGAMVIGVGQAILGDPHEAQDAFQATFLLLARNSRAIRKPDSLAAWLHGVARRVAMRARRDLVHRRIVERLATERRNDRETPAWCPELHEEIDGLPDRYRSPIVLCGLEGYTHEEAARQLGWPVGTVKVRLMRGRERLRSRLVRRGLAPAALVLTEIPAETTASPEISATVPLMTRGGTVSARVAQLVISTSRSLFMVKVRTMACALVATCGLALAAGWGLHHAAGAGNPPPKDQAVADEPKAPAPKPAKFPPGFNDRMAAWVMATMGNMRPLVKDEKGVRFQSREAVVYKNGQVLLWDLQKEKLACAPIRHENEPIHRADFVDGSNLLVTESNNSLELWDALTGAFKGELKGEQKAMIGFGCAEQSGLYATVGSDEQTFSVWDPAAPNLVRKLKVSTAPHRLAAVALTPDGKTLATFRKDGVVQLYIVSTGRLFATMGPESPLIAALFKGDSEPGGMNYGNLEIDAPFWKLVRSLAP